MPQHDVVVCREIKKKSYNSDSELLVFDSRENPDGDELIFKTIPRNKFDEVYQQRVAIEVYCSVEEFMSNMPQVGWTVCTQVTGNESTIVDLCSGALYGKDMHPCSNDRDYKLAFDRGYVKFDRPIHNYAQRLS